MATLSQLEAQISLLLSSPERRRSPALEEAAEIEERDLAQPEPLERRRFSAFDDRQLEEATAFADRLMGIANARGGEEGVRAAFEEATRAMGAGNRELIQHGFMLFLTHHPVARTLRIEPLEVRMPDKVLASRGLLEAAGPPAPAPEPFPVPRGGSTEPERGLDWFREDPLMNEHHQHWHLVYPGRGVPDGAGNRRLRPRQGELFLYMHQQMIARYDAERFARDLGQVRSYQDFREPFSDGYYPGTLTNYSDRPPGLRPAATLGNFDTLLEHETLRDRLLRATDSGYFEVGDRRVPVTPDLLGATAEPTIGSVSESYYGRYHNQGHTLIALASGAYDFGVIGGPVTAVRDPIFFRWHKHIDDLHARWQDRQPPNDLGDAPNVLLRKGQAPTGTMAPSHDLILAFRDAIPGAASDDFDGARFGQAAFGGDRWDTDFTAGQFTTADGVQFSTTDELQTGMQRRTISVRGYDLLIDYLNNREFVYFIRLQNRDAAPKKVTVRVFLVPDVVVDGARTSEDRRLWIEMDKFVHELQASERAVVYRRSDQSAVVRKPAIKDPSKLGQLTHVDLPVPDDDGAYCSCGWPYSMLLPRGTREGMPFQLMVMVTDWQLDAVSEDARCGSMSFCGTTGDQYPDKRSMGYPFDRRFPVRVPGRFRGLIADTVTAQHNMAARPVRIRWTDLPQPAPAPTPAPGG
jgi:hypothetical protein